ncbi:hypothetical protein SNE40_003616 [Patella caerulea]|uniref:Gustatory receptor n=1 Tax=Patella caerulea TaxID=87958 RepID=A0AAN8KBI3_PATCE
MDVGNSLTCKSLKPLLLILPWFGLNRFRGSNGGVIQGVVIVIHITCYTIFGVNVSWCLVGAEKTMDHKNIAIYIAILLATAMRLIVTLYGMIFVPSKLHMIITACDQLRSNPWFYLSYKKLRRFTKVMVIICVIACIVLTFSMIFTSSIITNDYICVTASARRGSLFYWTTTVNAFPAAALVFGHKFILLLTINVMCKIVTMEFNACNTEFRKIADSDVTFEKIQMIRKRYFAITKLAEQVDEFLNPYVVLKIGVSFTGVCLYIHALAYGHSSLGILLLWCGWLILAISEMLMIFKSGIALNESVSTYA